MIPKHQLPELMTRGQNREDGRGGWRPDALAESRGTEDDLKGVGNVVNGRGRGGARACQPLIGCAGHRSARIL